MFTKRLAAAFVFFLSLLPVSAYAAVTVYDSRHAAGGFYASGTLGYSGFSTSGDSGKVSYGGYDASVPLGSEASGKGVALGVGFGYDFSVAYDAPVRMEVALLGRFSGKDAPDASAGEDVLAITSFHTLMLNVWGMLPVKGPVRFYFGGGAGLAVAGYDYKFDSMDLSPFYPVLVSGQTKDTATAAAFNLGLGLDLNISQRLSLDLGYRYTLTSDFDMTLLDYQALSFGVETSVRSHDFLVGLRVKF